jgi:hypothetical protein
MYRVLNTIYRIADNTRIVARASEIYEKQLYLHTHQATMAPQEAIQLLDEIIEDTKRLAVFNWVLAKQQDDDARDYSFKALRVSSIAQHLTRQEDSGSKRPAFDESFIQQYNEAKYQHSVFRAATNPSFIEPEEVFPTEVFPKDKEMTVTFFGTGLEVEPLMPNTTIATAPSQKHQQTT